MSFKFLLILFCCNELIYGQSPGTKTQGKLKSDKNEKDNKDIIEPPNYGPLIEKIQNDLNNLNLNEISSYGIEISNAKTELIKINDRLTQYEQKQSDIIQIKHSIHAINPLSKRIETLENNIQNIENNNANSTSFNDTIDIIKTEINNIDDRINKLASINDAMSREITDNKKRLEIIEESLSEHEKEMENIKKSIQKISVNMERSEKRFENTFKSIKDRFESIEKSLNVTNTNLQIVYDSTVGAAVDKFVSVMLDYLADFGQVCVDIMANIQNKIVSMWKSFYDVVSDQRQQKLFTDWLYGVYKYATFWWVSAIQPAIIRQATNLYFGVQIFVKDSIKSIHSSPIYNEMIQQSKVYLKMANIPMEYNGYIIDALLILFCVSSLITLSFICGLCCDCCCPKKVLMEGKTNVANDMRTKSNLNGRVTKKQNQKKSKKKYKKHIKNFSG